MYSADEHYTRCQDIDAARRPPASMRDRVRRSRRRVLVVEVMEVRRLLATATVALVPSSASPTYGDRLHFTAIVSSSNPGSPTPTGAVQFVLDGTPVGPAFPLSGGATTTPDIDTLPAGVHAIGAMYSGDGTFAPSSTTLP